MNWSKTVLSGSLLLTVLFVGCGPSNNTLSDRKLLESAATGVPAAREMEELFGESEHFITYTPYKGKEYLWHSTVYFGGRYELTLNVYVKINFRTKTVTQDGAPKFYLLVADKVEFKNDRAHSMSFIGEDQRIFGEKKWAKLRDSGGDLTTVGVTPRPTPVKGFEEFAERVGRHRVPITLTGNKEVLRRYRKWRKQHPPLF